MWLLTGITYPQRTSGNIRRHFGLSQRGGSTGIRSIEASNAVCHAVPGKPSPEQRTVGANTSARPRLTTRPRSLQQPAFPEALIPGLSSSAERCPPHTRVLVSVVPAWLTPPTTDEETFPGALKIARWQKEQGFSAAIFIRPYLPGNVLSVGYYHVMIHILPVKIMHLL